MEMIDHGVRQTEAPQDDAPTDSLGQVEAAVEAARAGRLSEDEAFEAIARIVRKRSADEEIYQKPWG